VSGRTSLSGTHHARPLRRHEAGLPLLWSGGPVPQAARPPRLCPLSLQGRDLPHEHGGRLLAAVQGVSALNARACQPEAHAVLSRRVHLPREPPRARERDVRPSARGAVTRSTKRSKSATETGPTPSASA